MLKKFILIATFVLISAEGFSQRPILELTFSAINNEVNVQLDSIKIMNRTQGGDTVLYWPDTVLSLYYTGISETGNQQGDFRVLPNYPNPVEEWTIVPVFIPAESSVDIMITDMLGRRILSENRRLDKGMHTYIFRPGDENLYFFTARWNGQMSNIKIMSAVTSGKCAAASINYEGLNNNGQILNLKSGTDMQDFAFAPGDELLYIGYFENLESGISDTPEESKTYTFQFAYNIPCPGLPTVEYEGQVYNTIQIFSQCWLKENLNVGVMVSGNLDQSNNQVIEKYCYGNDEIMCTTRGGLYQWTEAMEYYNKPGARGICPPGWHLPTNEDWNVLEGAADSYYGIGDTVWDWMGIFRGYDAGKNLKAISGWAGSGNGVDLYGFSGIAGGHRNVDHHFYGTGYCGYYWTSTAYSDTDALVHWLSWDDPGAVPEQDDFKYGFSVRCLKDE